MNLSHYVFEQSDCFFNSVTSKQLPKDSDEATLREHFFLDGQEQEAVHHRLFGDPVTQVGIKVIPTWRCNLRCKHCFVLHKLVKEDSQPFDTEAFLKFVDEILATAKLQRFGVSFIGGEATLEAPQVRYVIEEIEKRLEGTGTKFISTLTSNGTLWNRDVAELLNTVKSIMFSLDSHAVYHNWQRIPYDQALKGQDLYQLTLRNIKRAVMMGFGPKIRVQASLYDEGFKEEHLRQFYKDVLAAGIPEDRIVVGSAVPTPINQRETNLYRKYLASYVFNRPCCTYRYGRELVADCSGNIYADYFKESEWTHLGTFQTPFPEIIEKHKQMVLNTMPVLNDDKCKVCPVLGACWGRCSNSEFLKPSDICDPQALHQVCKTLADQDKLVSRYIKVGPNDSQPESEDNLYTHS